MGTNPKDLIGAKKPPLHCIPPSSLIQLGLAMENGMKKYGLMNWRDNDVVAHIYYDAAMRHLMSWWDGEDVAEDSLIDHLGHVMACCAILIDAKHNNNLSDDRPRAGHVSAMIDTIHKDRVSRSSGGFRVSPGVSVKEYDTSFTGTYESGKPVIPETDH